jgi:tetratricopeptide (TPR) repeat protein
VALLDSAVKIEPWSLSAPRDRYYVDYIDAAAAANRPDLMLRALNAQRKDDPGIPLAGGAAGLPKAEASYLRATGQHQAAMTEFRKLAKWGGATGIDAEYARTWDLMGQKDSATVYFERQLASTSLNFYLWFDGLYAQQSRLRLGELYAERGQADKAYQVYADFVNQWKNADAALQPQVDDVRARMRRIQAQRAR